MKKIRVFLVAMFTSGAHLFELRRRFSWDNLTLCNRMYHCFKQNPFTYALLQYSLWRSMIFLCECGVHSSKCGVFISKCVNHVSNMWLKRVALLPSFKRWLAILQDCCGLGISILCCLQLKIDVCKPSLSTEKLIFLFQEMENYILEYWTL